MSNSDSLVVRKFGAEDVEGDAKPRQSWLEHVAWLRRPRQPKAQNAWAIHRPSRKTSLRIPGTDDL